MQIILKSSHHEQPAAVGSAPVVSNTKTYSKGEHWPYQDEEGNFLSPHEKNADFKGRQVKQEYLGSVGSEDQYQKQKLMEAIGNNE